MYRPTRFRLVPKSMTLNDLRAKFKVIYSLNDTKMAKYTLVKTSRRHVHVEWLDNGYIISIRPTYSCAGALTYLFTYLLAYTQLARAVSNRQYLRDG